jgi:hypothetical protein
MSKIINLPCGLLAAESSRKDLGLPEDWSRIWKWCLLAPMSPILAHALSQTAPKGLRQPTGKIDVNWKDFAFKEIPREPETRVNIEALEKLVNENKGRLLSQELARAERTINYQRHGAPALQLTKLKSCLVPNKPMTLDARAAVLKTIEDWIKKGFVAGPFREPPLDNFRVNGMIAIIKGEYKYP